jgi:putative oxidoreductase
MPLRGCPFDAWPAYCGLDLLVLPDLCSGASSEMRSGSLLLMGASMETCVDRKKLFVPGLAKLYESLAPLSYTLIRFSLGVFLIPHGYAKLFQDDAVAASRNFVNFGWSYPLAWAYFIGALEFFGGIMLAIGLLTRVVAAAIVIEMSVISFGVLWPVWSWGRRGMEYALLMGIVALAILFRGGGRYSVDHHIGREF